MIKSKIVGKIYEYLYECRDLLCPWVKKYFPKDNNWWEKRVIKCFEGRQVQLSSALKIKDKSFGSMDLAMLIHLVMYNWKDLNGHIDHQGDEHKILESMLKVRNSYSHSSDVFPSISVIKQDLDIIQAFLRMFNAKGQLISDVEGFKESLNSDTIKTVSSFDVVLNKALRNNKKDATSTIESTPNVLSETRDEREKFWGNYIRILEDRNNPFTICARNQYSAINLPYPTIRQAGPIIEFLTRKSMRLMRVSIYIANDKKTPCYDEMYSNKEKIEGIIGHELIWKEGDKNPDAKRIQYEIKYDEKDVQEDYVRIIKESIPIAQQFIKIADEYIPPEYRG